MITLVKTTLEFAKGKTTISSDVQFKDKLEMPSVTFCAQKGLKNNKLNLDLEEYLNNTMELDDFFHELFHYGGDDIKVNHEVKTIMTMNRGRCYTFEFDERMTTLRTFTIKTKSSQKLKFIIHEPGEEIWIYNGIWPPSSPKFHEFGNEFYDVKIRKRQKVKTKNCQNSVTTQTQRGNFTH